VGHGFDVHAFGVGRPLWLGGIQIPHDRGLVGHSDGDALLHAVTSALLGALGEGDLGAHFPSSDERWRGAASAAFVAHALALMRARGFALGNLDATVIAQEPRLAPHQAAMRRRVAALLEAPESAVSVKVTSTDRLGAIGRGDGIAVQAVVLIESARPV
jgi:2-C-methyl-D-erythritol 4-phosphate cytidylyltransferase/2-C-methyl-D-erythritol 2,4-cyclodiphosphate synthase